MQERNMQEEVTFPQAYAEVVSDVPPEIQFDFTENLICAMHDLVHSYETTLAFSATLRGTDPTVLWTLKTREFWTQKIQEMIEFRKQKYQQKYQQQFWDRVVREYFSGSDD